MTVIITSHAVLGPFATVEVKVEEGAEVVVADDFRYHASVIGDYTISEDDSLAPPRIEPLGPVPEAIDPLDGLLALSVAGYANAYEAWANDPARTFEERAFIAKAKVWRRDDPLLQGAARALGITPEQLDQLFRLAAPK